MTVEDGFLHCSISIMNEKFGGLNDFTFLAQWPLIKKEFLIKIYFLFVTNTTASYAYYFIYLNSQIEETRK